MTVKKENSARLISCLFGIMGGLKKNVNECCASNCELSEKEFHVVAFVGQHGEVKMSDIAELIASPMSTVTSIVDKLVEKKYLDRFHSKEDRRVVQVALVGQGQELYSKFIAQKQEMASGILKDFSSSEQEQLLGYLERMTLGFQN